MKRYMVKIEAGGEWHRFVVEAIHGHSALASFADIGVPREARYGIREAKEDEFTNEPTKADVDRRTILLGHKMRVVEIDECPISESSSSP